MSLISLFLQRVKFGVSKQRFESISNNFGYQLVEHIAEINGTIISNSNRLGFLLDESNVCVIECKRNLNKVEGMQKSFSVGGANSVPVALKE